MASTNLTRTVVTPTAQKFTFSAWVKRSKIGSRQGIYKVINPSSPASYGYLEFQSDDRLNFDDFNGASSRFTRVSDANFRDTNGWYHIVVSMDATGVADSEKAKIYVNGEEVAYVGQTNDSLSSLTTLTSGKTFNLGSHGQSNLYYDGSMSHVHFIDGTVYAPSEFGETDANGVWKIKTDVSVTYGNNGFFILKDGNSVTDQSGNGNNLTVAGGTLTNTEDNPSNVFATINALDANGCTLSLGNNRTAFSSTFSFAKSTLGWSAGKYYMEAKASTITDRGGVGIVKSLASAYTTSTIDSNRIFYHSNGNVYTNVIDGGSTSVATISQGDIIGIEVDMSAGTCKFYKNGSAIHTVTSSIISDNEWQFLVGGLSITWDTNFGNGYFGTTAVASAGTNASGIGIFEYDVPTGYTALSTKGLNL